MVTLLLDHQAAVKEYIEALVVRSTPPSPLREMCLHHLNSGGKGFRSALCLSLCRALGADPVECLPAAVSLELAHRTSLVFDDIQDHTPERNGQPALWHQFGTEQALNAGLALSACARLSLTELTSTGLPDGAALRVLGILESSVVTLCQGQYWDLEFQKRPPPDLVDYLVMVSEKTGTLVGAACQIAGVLAGVDSELLAQFGSQLGVLFQCRDDYLGIWGDPAVVGKTPTDLSDGKRSLPVVLAYESRPEAVRAALSGVKALRPEAMDKLKELVGSRSNEARTLGVVDDQKVLANLYLRQMEDGVLSQGMVKELRTLVEFVAQRDL